MKRTTLLFLALLLTAFGCSNPAAPGGNGEAAGGGSGDPTRPWAAAYAFDGVSDFTLEETFATSDGGQVFVGWDFSSSADALILKVDSDGAPLWARRLDAAGDELATAGVEAPDGDLIVAGMAAETLNQFGLLMLRLSPDGRLEHAYAADMTDLADFPEAVFVHDGDLLIVGNLMDSTLAEAEDAFVYRIGAIPTNIVEASDGTFYPTDVDSDSATHVYGAVVHDDELLLSVSTDTNSGGTTTDAGLISLPAAMDGGTPRAAAVLGRENSFPAGDDRFADLRVLPDGDVLAVGTTDSFTPTVRDNDVWAVRLTWDGSDQTSPWSSVWQKLYVGAADDTARSLVPSADGYGVFGTTQSFGAGGTDAWLLEVDTDGLVQDEYAFGGTLDEVPIGVVGGDGGFALAGESASFTAQSRPGHVWAVRGTSALDVPASLRSDTSVTVSSTFTSVSSLLPRFGDTREKTPPEEIDLSSLTFSSVSVTSELQ